MLTAFIEMKDLVVAFLDRSSNGMSEYILDDEEWAVINGLVSALKVCFKDSFLCWLLLTLL